MKRLLSISTSLIIVLFFTPIADASEDLALDVTEVPRVWSLGFIGENTTVAFIDEEVNTLLPEFKESVIGGYCIITDTNTPEVCPNGKKEMIGVEAIQWTQGDGNHGNMVAGVIHSVAPGAKLFPIKAIGGSPALAKAAQFLLEHKAEYGIQALSMSFGADIWPSANPNRTDWPTQSCYTVAKNISPADGDFADSLRDLDESGVALFAASGNVPTFNFNRFTFPACLSWVHSIGAATPTMKVSNYVTMSKDVEFIAPDYTKVPQADGTYVTAGGTSAATPYMAAIYVLLKSVNSSKTSDEILQTIKETAYKVDDVEVKGLSHPRAYAAARKLIGGTTAYSSQISLVWTLSENQSPLTFQLRKQIDEAMGRNPGASTVICTGVIHTSRAASVGLLISKRAANACAYVKKNFPHVTTRYQSKRTSQSSWNGRVLVTIKSD